MRSSTSSWAPRRRSARRSGRPPRRCSWAWGAGPLLMLPGAAGRDPGPALDLGPVQRPVGDAVPRDVRVAPRPLRDADGRHGAGRRADRLRAAGDLAAGPAAAGRPWLALVWLASAARSAPSASATSPAGWHPCPPRSIAQEAEEIWAWIRQVGPDDAVIADYEVSAPLSSRRWLYSYILDVNLPPGFPHLGPEFRWLFVRERLALLKSCWIRGSVSSTAATI